MDPTTRPGEETDTAETGGIGGLTWEKSPSQPPAHWCW